MNRVGKAASAERERGTHPALWRTPERDIVIAEGCFCHFIGIGLGNDSGKWVAKINCVEGMLCPYK